MAAAERHAAAREVTGRRTLSRSAIILLAVALGLLAVAAFWPSDVRSAQVRVNDVAAQLRCPTCVGESVADSTSPISQSMRAVIVERVAAGEGDADILKWFADVYGPGVLLDPAPAGPALLVWVIPVVLVAAAVLLVLRRRRWPWAIALAVTAAAALVLPAVLPQRGAAPAPERVADAAGILSGAVARSPGDATLQQALAGELAAAGRSADALEHYAAAYRLQPADPQVAEDYATALDASGETATAISVLRHQVDSGPDARSLLLLGLMLVRQHDPDGPATLRRYLELVPDSPMRAQIESLIAPAGE